MGRRQHDDDGKPWSPAAGLPADRRRRLARRPDAAYGDAAVCSAGRPALAWLRHVPRGGRLDRGDTLARGGPAGAASGHPVADLRAGPPAGLRTTAHPGARARPGGTGGRAAAARAHGPDAADAPAGLDPDRRLCARPDTRHDLPRPARRASHHGTARGRRGPTAAGPARARFFTAALDGGVLRVPTTMYAQGGV